MKNSLLLVSLLLIIGSPRDMHAQATTTNGTSKPAPVVFSEVVMVKDASASELYTRAQLWFSTAFADSKNVLEVQDKQAGFSRQRVIRL